MGEKEDNKKQKKVFMSRRLKMMVKPPPMIGSPCRIPACPHVGLYKSGLCPGHDDSVNNSTDLGIPLEETRFTPSSVF